MAAAGSSGLENDPRMRFLEVRVMNAIKPKPEKWKGTIMSMEGGRALLDFLENAETRRLIIYDDGGKDALKADCKAPPTIKKRGLYFIKKRALVLNAENMPHEVIVGDMTTNTMSQLSIISQEVFLPLLSTSRNREGWSDVMSKEILDNLHHFIGNSTVTIGQMQGKTLLPLPASNIQSVDKASKDKDKVHLLESAVVTWTRLIKNVLWTEPESLLQGGQHPGPMAEVDFWQAKAANLNSIHEQLSGDKIAKLIKILQLSKSTYYNAFSRLFQDVAQARQEANDNAKYLRASESIFRKLSSGQFSDLLLHFKPMMHLVALTWKKSMFYNTVGRLVVLMREICNELIEQSRMFVNASELFKVEPQEAVDRLKMTIKVCNAFKQAYLECKSKIVEECPKNPWRVQNSAVFTRLDTFIERCHDLLDLTQTVMQFSKLERIEIGGTKGRMLSASVRQTYDEFFQAFGEIQNLTYDMLDIENHKFDDDYFKFRSTIKELERRLGSILTQGLDDCVTINSAFKLIDSFEGLCDREIIQADLEKKHSDLVRDFAEDLQKVQEQFQSYKTDPPLYLNMPPVAGALMWCRGLIQRIEEPMEKFKQFKQMLESEEGKEIVKTYDTVLGWLKEYEVSRYQEWEKAQEDVSQEKLKQSLLRKHKTNPKLLAVNFNPALVRLLREVKYFTLLQLDIPESAMQIYKKAETFRTQIGNLELIVNTYNSIHTTILEVERPLLQKQLTEIDKLLEKGLKHLNWKSHGIGDFISEAMTKVKGAHAILTTLKGDVAGIQRVLDLWASNTLFKRKEAKTYAPDEIQVSQMELIDSSFGKMMEGGQEMHKLLGNSNKMLKVSKGAPSWKAYVEYVSDVVIQGIAVTIINSLEYLRKQVDPVHLQKTDTAPLMEIKLELLDKEVIFVPELGVSPKKDGVRDTIETWIEDFLKISTLVKRLDTGDGDYMVEIKESEDIAVLINAIGVHIQQNEEKCHRFRDTFCTFSYLWNQDLQSTFQEFLDSTAAEGRQPSLEEFDQRISRYKPVQDAIQNLPNTQNIGWLRIDAKPIKQTLNTWISKWIFLYVNYLQQRVVKGMAELYEFMQRVEGRLDQEVSSGSSELYELMGYMRDVRVRTEATDNMFEPTKQTVSLLKKYGTTMQESVMQQLEEAPNNWSNCKRKTALSKERINPLINAEAEKIKSRGTHFSERIASFRTDFKQHAPFKWTEDVDDAYQSLDRYNLELSAIENEAKMLNEHQELFDLMVAQYKEVKDTRAEITALKQVWDMASFVVFTFSDWKKTLWDEINVDYLMEESRKIQKEVRLLNKLCREWDVFKGLEDCVKNLMTSLPLVQDLHSPAMRERHWKALMRATGVMFTLDANFSLADLLGLNLHKYVDAVAEIVDRANKELIIEKNLAKIEATWASLSLQYIPYEDTETLTLQAPDEVIESKDDNLVQLQNMASGKYVANNPDFQEQVSKWQRKLGAVDSVLTTWLEVQKKWASLESIFIGSADIRTQLPEDSKRFDAVDVEWKELMKEAQPHTNAVDACNVEGRGPRLEHMLQLLEQCEKSLADYLETKRVAFPRFYFVAAADLVDILSKGSNPHAIQKHLSKCFDNIQKLKFEDGKDGKPSKNAIGMYSKEGEYVPFAVPYPCEGAVEVWLTGLVTAMQDALKHVLREAAVAYDEMPRHKWLFKYCAQLVVVVSRIMYTEDVNHCFDQMEEGNELALKDYNRKQAEQLIQLSDLIIGELTSNDRRKVITLITVDVHARDVVGKLIVEKCDKAECFQWVSQLRYTTDEATKLCRINICDFEIFYQYEYIGNCGCLVITPLTDRCYVTLTQAQRLCLGGAPAGPAGTGKTETTKDLARAIGIMCYVFNCSDQMDYKSMGQIYKGLAQTGSWGCFDEFNRIPLEVLSVCSTQYKSILDAIRAKKKRFIFEDEEISIVPTACAFITMNPGYAGRTELPESLKALFRPVAMIVPDMDLITEIMLFSEGFRNGKILARKFMILYRLCQDLLSKQDHYDWKLRAIKTTLNVAGGLKRSDPELSEDRVLLRALRDFNIGKIVMDDIPIFMGLLEDLFPKTLEHVPRKRDNEFEALVKESCLEHGLQPEDKFLLKCIQLRELFVVRWSVFLLGPAGSGKTEVWKTLSRSQVKNGEKTFCQVLNPKAVTRNELYGYISPATREWRDGLISQIFRDMANTGGYQHQWIVLDGDIDAEWIESMNTVMDDNKMLTLASNERIALTNPMRLLFEIGDMRNASPATVSRGGVIFINDNDIGWRPFVQTWIDNQKSKKLQQILEELFHRYVQRSLDYCRKNFRYITPLNEINMIATLCYVLDGLFTFQEAKGINPVPVEGVVSANPNANLLTEFNFVFAAIWALGGALLSDKANDFRLEFSRWWKEEWKVVKFPDAGLVFDYCVDPESVSLAPWAEKMVPYAHQGDVLFANIFVPTMDTTRLSYLLDLFIPRRRSVMFVGNAGTGKTCIIRDKLRSLDFEATISVAVNMNCFTDSMSLQLVLEQPCEKKTGRVYGPPGLKKLIYFIDDLNMPFVDKYGTQSAIALLRQHIDYQMWYDRGKLTQKEILNCQYITAMNPTAGSFTVDPRLQKSFATFGVLLPNQEDLFTIYESILRGHLAKFDPSVSGMSRNVIKASIELHKSVAETFLPTAVKFHYIFNLRELSSVVQGLCLSSSEYYSSTTHFARLWMHECERVFRDRLVGDADTQRFDDMLSDVSKKYFESEEQAVLHARPLLYCGFIAQSSDDSLVYIAVTDYAKLKKVLDEKMNEYNECNATMSLVLFEQAIEHVCRITRIIQSPRGNALLVGVGGSGKQSLARLASFICGYEVFQISVTQTYGVTEFKADILNLYIKAGVKGFGMVFLLTDGQIVDERFMVYINDLLSSGYIPDLFSLEDKDNIINSIRAEVKQSGVPDTRENCWDFFIEKVRKNLHVCLCVSPVGDKFRIRARQFPAMISCTVIDWFTEWSNEALVSVAQRFLREIENVEPEVRDNIAHHMAFVHNAVIQASASYLETERRYNYTTPKSFLELISLYKALLQKKREGIALLKQRLENGLNKLKSTEAIVADLQVALKQDQIVVEEKKATADTLLEQVGKETAIAQDEQAIAQNEEAICGQIAADVMEKQSSCAQDLAKAEPIIQQAEIALNSLDKKALTEMKAFASPPSEVVSVIAAVMILTAPGKIPKDQSWNNGKKLMSNVDRFLQSLLTFDKDHIPDICVTACEEKINADKLDPDVIRTKSSAAAGLCSWVLNICKYFRIYQDVAPKRARLEEANQKLQGANQKLSIVRARVADLEARLATLTAKFEQAALDKELAIQQAEKTQTRANLAERLVGGLADEKIRWTESIARFTKTEATLVGDVLLSAAFVSYIGAFNQRFRTVLLSEKWIPDLQERQIPMTEGIEPLDKLTDEAEIARWGNEGLPADALSVQNGAIVCSSARWPLLIDPQLQGIKWLLKREMKNGLKLIQLSQPRYVDTIEHAIQNGLPVLIENLGENVDAVLDPVLSRSTIKRGRQVYVKVGDKEVEFDPHFRLYLQTKLPNPHYKPEICAQCTLINFTVTEEGLEDQLLTMVVNKERPDLEATRAELLKQQNDFKITLKELEDNLLFRLSNAQGDILSDIDLIENLETTKKTAKEIAIQVEAGKETSKGIALAREIYRPVAIRGAVLYFLIDSLSVLDHMYQFSMANFVTILKKGMDLAEPAPDLEARVINLIDSASYTVFAFVASGLFERHKLIFGSQLAIRILQKKGEINHDMLEYLLRGPKAGVEDNPCSDWLPDAVWNGLVALKDFETFETLPADVEGSAKRWKEWYEVERPEKEHFPGDWKRLANEPFLRCLVMRAFRPDRMTDCMSQFVSMVLGARYASVQPPPLEIAYTDAKPDTPVFFILSPGVDPVKDVENLGKKFGLTYESGKLANVSLGQGQEPIAERALEKAHRAGGWVILQNVHLTPKWTGGYLEKRMDKIAEGAHEDFRLFLSAEPSDSIPINILQSCIKLSNEPPEGLRANLIRSLGAFSDELFENSTKQSELKSIVFALCFFHAVLLERKRFGSIGWNMKYPFNIGDLTSSAMVSNNYLENNAKVPWDDLRYIFGEIMYGGHIVDDWDRRLCNTYLSTYMKDELLEGLDLFPGFITPKATNIRGYVRYVETNLQSESPACFGMHPNAEIGFRLDQAETLFRNILELQPRSAAGGAGGMSLQDKAKMVLDEIIDKLPPVFVMEEVTEKLEERTPYTNVFLQEIERMNILSSEMRRSLLELDLGLKGDLTISEPMEMLMRSLFDDKVPDTWEKRAYPSLRPLASWMLNLYERIKQLTDWTADLQLPKVTWLSGLFNPQSFLTAVMQTTARKNDWPLDKTVIQTEVTKKKAEEIEAGAREGAFIHGLVLEGARWDEKAGGLEEQIPKELFAAMPVMCIKAVTADKAEERGNYACPVYKTQKRGNTYVFTAGLKTRAPAAKWILSGTSLIMDVVR